MDREELLDREEEAWATLLAAAERVPTERRMELGAVPGWSVQDLLWHAGFWAGFVADVLDRLAKGEPEVDEDWDRVNEQEADRSKAMTWDAVLAGCERFRERARAALQAQPELTDRAIEEFSDETFAHYDEHRAEIEAFAG